MLFAAPVAATINGMDNLVHTVYFWGNIKGKAKISVVIPTKEESRFQSQDSFVGMTGIKKN